MPPTVFSSDVNHERKFNFPYEIVDVEENLNNKLKEDFKGELTGFVQIGPKKYFMPIKYRQDAESIYNFKVRPDDVWIVTFPRSGTTWTQEMVWLIANDCDFQTAAEIPLLLRFPFFEYSTMVHPEIKAQLIKENEPDLEKMNVVQKMDLPMWIEFEKMNSRRFIKTHLPFSLLPPDLLTCGCKVIYVARNPKDVAISYFHLNRFMRTLGYVNDLPTFWNYFQDNLVNWAPQIEHVKEGWEKRNEKNVLFLFYEQINKDLAGTMKNIATFLNKTLTESQINQLKEHLDIKNFRNNRSVNFDMLSSIGVSKKNEQAFIRKGKSGNWKDEFDEDWNARSDKWIESNLVDTDMRFPDVN